jgi:ribosomal protein S18 acetylase RimI-like enzyme
MIEADIDIRRASVDDLDAIAPLFDAYRQFYGQPPALDAAREFLRHRFERRESTVLVAEDDLDSIIGFAQLFPTFSSVTLATTFVLNDLFVAPASRRRGVARALLRSAAAFGRAQQAIRITLSTQTTNVAAQSLYMEMGWVLQTEYQVYTKKL